MNDMIFKTSIARENWEKNYKYGDETPFETQVRVAKALASVEKPKVREYWEKEFLKTLVKYDSEGNPVGLKCTPGGRITANAGTSFKKATMLNCFIAAPVKSASIKYHRSSDIPNIKYDVEIKTSDTPDDLFNIFLTIMEQAKTLASEGGYGLNFDFIRPRGSIIKGTGIKHPGVVAYMKIWDSVSECIVKGTDDGYTDRIKNHIGKEQFEHLKSILKNKIRKGAMLSALSCFHPDCEEYVRAKQESGVLTKFNMSVLIDDAFLTAVEKDDFYDQSFNGVVYKRIKARDLYNLIMESTFNRGEPGVLFYDNMQRNNPVSYLGKVNAANPCGEVPGLSSSLTSVCLLGSLNLTQYVEIDDLDDKPFFDWEEYGNDILTFTRMLDNVNDLTYNPLPGYDWVMKNLRQIGVGVNGLGSVLMMLGIPYNSKEAIAFITKMGFMKENLTWKASALIAKEKGTFPAYRRDLFESTEYFKSKRITEDTRALLHKYGPRNAKTTTHPPLGSSSILCNNVSNGIEPVFELEYERKIICKEWPSGLEKDNITSILKHYKEKDYEYWQGDFNNKKYYYEPHNRGLCEISNIRDYGYQWLLDNYPNRNHSGCLSTAKNLKVEDHIKALEAVQFYCNQSSSKTINLPNDYSFEEFKSLYLDAWKRGLNGLTTYRDGTMESVLSSIHTRKSGVVSKDIKLPSVFLNGPTHIIKREKNKFYMHFSYLPEDTKMEFPIVLWIYSNAQYKDDLRVCNKAARRLSQLALTMGVDRKIVEETLVKANQDYPHNRLGRLISLNLRHNVPRVDILGSLFGVEGDNISTLLSSVRKFLSQTLADGTRLKSAHCPKCQSTNVVLQSGCISCRDCQYVGCGG